MKAIKIFPYIPDNISVEQISDNRVKISAYPFETGYAITLAHPIRRLIMSSSVGYAIVGIKINGVTHEFDSIRGMVEDVSLFIINLKKLQFKLRNDEETSVTLSYSLSGEKVVTGADFNNDIVEVINPNIYVATINSDTNIEFSIIVNKGIGYIPSEDLRGMIPESFIPIDAYFTPVKKVIYEIENVLVKDDPTFEKIIFDIETDGRITAIEAFRHAISIMNKQMGIFNSELKIADHNTKEVEQEPSELKVLFQTIDTLNFSARCSNCLDKINLKYIGELLLMKESEIRNIKNLGKKSYDEIVEKIQAIGYQVGEALPNNIKEILNKKFNK